MRTIDDRACAPGFAVVLQSVSPGVSTNDAALTIQRWIDIKSNRRPDNVSGDCLRVFQPGAQLR